jgi:hypothetical protein
MSILKKVSTGVVGIATLGLGAYAVAFVPSPLTSAMSVVTTVVAPEAVTRSIVCSGDVVGYVGDSAEISTVSGTRMATTAGVTATELAMGESTNGSVVTRSGDSQAVAATEVAGVRGESVVGYLATECGDALNEQWLVGGSTTTGRDTIVTISNGSDVDARVDLEIWGSKGLVDAPGSRGIIIPPNSQRSYSVAGFAPDEPSPAVHLTSSGAAVWATLHTTTVRGLVPGGLDRVGPIAGPTTTVSFPLLHIASDETIGAVLGDASYSDIVAALRFLVPGDIDSSVTITLDPYDDGESIVVTATIAAGATFDIPLSDLDEGDWSVTIESEQPLVAAARVGFHDTRTGITDIAWASSAPAQIGTASVVVPGGSVLGITNFTSADATVTLLSGGVSTDVIVPARGSYRVPVAAGLVTVTSATDVSTGVFVTTAEGIATLRGLTAPVDSANIVIIGG